MNTQHRVLTGAEKGFWSHDPEWDADQRAHIAEAVRQACALPTATPAERWALVQREIVKLAAEYEDWLNETGVL